MNPKSPLEALLAPGLRLMQAVRLPVKFTIVAAALLVPLCVAVYGVVDYAESNIAFRRDERLGVAYVAPLSALLQEVTQSSQRRSRNCVHDPRCHRSSHCSPRSATTPS